MTLLSDLTTPENIAHLHGQTCPRCQHPHVDHIGNPSCRSCSCNSDPLCSVCKKLSTKHE